MTRREYEAPVGEAEAVLHEAVAHPTLQAFSRPTSQGSRRGQAPIMAVDRTQPLPLSWAQQHLWFLYQLDLATGATYHIPVALRLQGRLDRASLKRSLDRIVARHESLRTTFVNVEWEPRQVIAAEDSGFLLVEEDLRALTPADQEAAVASRSTEEASAAFDLTRGPLIRGRLLQLDVEEHVLLVTQHHIISDGWSIRVLVKEVSALYTAYSQGGKDPLPALPVQYVDYVAWQRNWLHGEVLDRHIEYWREQLQGAPALMEVPTDWPRPAVQSYRVDGVPIRLSRELTLALNSLSQHHGVTLFMTLLAGWSILLSRLSGQDTVVVGSPMANRQRTEVEPLIGFFVNTLPLRVELGSDLSLAELLKQVKATTLGAYAHQDLPFERVVEALHWVRSPSHYPIFQAMLDLNNTLDQEALSLPDLQVSGLGGARPTSQFDMWLSLTEAESTLTGSMAYSTDLYERVTVERWVGHLTTLLEAMAADPKQEVSGLPLLREEEQEMILKGFNTTQAERPQDQPIHLLFEERVREQPDALAVVCGEEQLTYGELNQRANRVAHRLVGLGVKPDDRVAIYAERCVEMVVGLLGILKAGGGYVPLDPLYPIERLAYMLEDSASVAVLTKLNLVDRLAQTATGSAILMLDCDDALSLQPEYNPVITGLGSRHLAYVIYTSGSTGRPKGVMVEHRQALHYLAHAHDCYLQGEIEGGVVTTPVSVDATATTLLTPWLAGKAVVLLDPDNQRSLAQVLQYCGLTTPWLFKLTPAHLEMLSNLKEVSAAETPHRFVVGGEQLTVRTLQRFRDRVAPNAIVINEYGPTETVVGCTTFVSDRLSKEIAGGNVPIGRPIANTKVYILDARHRPVPIGVVGELYIGGAGVARGYLNCPELTAKRFFADTFAGGGAARMYETGDFGRWLADGNIEYLGRKDFQVKVRGFRISLEEIAAELEECAEVSQALVLAREDGAGDKRLVAYVVPVAAVEISIDGLREQLEQKLPKYMVPSVYVRLDALPLTSNGKIDRKALPAPNEGAASRRAYETPMGEVEEALAEIWCELLRVERVGRHDHFFELGGHSLLVTHLVVRISERFQVNLTLRELFENPTLVELTAAIIKMQIENAIGDDLEVMQIDLDRLSEEELLQLLERRSMDV